jgi:hypothetical protein
MEYCDRLFPFYFSHFGEISHKCFFGSHPKYNMKIKEDTFLSARKTSSALHSDSHLD